MKTVQMNEAYDQKHLQNTKKNNHFDNNPYRKIKFFV